MSFSARVKAELATLPLSGRCCVTAELGAMVFGASVMTLTGNREVRLSFRAQSAAVIKRVLRLFNAAGPAASRPRLLLREQVAGRRQYLLQLSLEDSRRLLRDQGMLRLDRGGTERFSAPRRVMRRNCCRRAYLRGSFLACGYVSDPRRRYRAEWLYQDQARAVRLRRVLGHVGLQASVGSRRGGAIVTVSGGDQVAELLKLMGASLSVLSMENSRAEKSLTGSANRAVNCDQANLGRQLAAAQAQVAMIESLSKSRGLSSLPKALEAMARLRLSRPDASLEELGALAEPPVSKSAVQHRMRALKRLAEGQEEKESRE